MCPAIHEIAHTGLLSTYTQHELDRHIFFAIRGIMGNWHGVFERPLDQRIYTYGVLEEFVRPTLRQGSLNGGDGTCYYVAGNGMSVVAMHE